MNKKKLLLCAIAVLASVMPQSLWAYEWPGHDIYHYTDAYYGGGYSTNVTNNNQIYLYNIGAELEKDNVNRFFNTFGHWGVEGMVYEVGTRLFLNYQTYKTSGWVKFRILTSPDQAETTQNKVAWMWGRPNPDDNGLMCDRKTSWEESKSRTECATDWYFYRVKVDNTTNGGDYRYVIGCEGPEKKMHWLKRSTDNGLRKNIITAANISESEAKNDPNCQWLIVTRQELINRFSNYANNLPSDYLHPVDATFYIGDQNFSRNNKFESSWKRTDNVKIGNDKDQKSGDDDNYSVGSYKYDLQLTKNPTGASVRYNSIYGMFYNANIHGASGELYQETEAVSTAGYYMATIQGFYKPSGNNPNQKAYLYAEVQNPDNTTQTQIITNPLPLIDILPADKQPEGMTEAGVRFWENHENYATKVIVKAAAGAKIKIGVKLENGSNGDWVSVDNAQLKYIGNDYLISQAFANNQQYWPDEQKFKTLILIRQFVPNKWNSFTLPLNLNKDQVLTAFGNDVKLAKLKTLSNGEHTIQFETVDLNKLSWTDDAINMNEPYLIYPTVEGRKYDIKWEDYFDAQNKPIVTKGPNYVIPLTHFKKENSQEKDITVYDANNKKITIHALQYYHTNQAGATYPQIAASKDNYIYAMHKGNLRRMTNSFSIPGLTFYVEFSENPASGAKLLISDEENGNETTAIEAIEDNSSANETGKRKGVYNVSGQKMLDGNSTKGLPTGIYIVDGEKVMVY